MAFSKIQGQQPVISFFFLPVPAYSCSSGTIFASPRPLLTLCESSLQWFPLPVTPQTVFDTRWPADSRRALEVPDTLCCVWLLLVLCFHPYFYLLSPPLRPPFVFREANANIMEANCSKSIWTQHVNFRIVSHTLTCLAFCRGLEPFREWVQTHFYSVLSLPEGSEGAEDSRCASHPSPALCPFRLASCISLPAPVLSWFWRTVWA